MASRKHLGCAERHLLLPCIMVRFRDLNRKERSKKNNMINGLDTFVTAFSCTICSESTNQKSLAPHLGLECGYFSSRTSAFCFSLHIIILRHRLPNAIPLLKPICFLHLELVAMSFTAHKSLGRFDVPSAKILLPADSTVKRSCLKCWHRHRG